MTVVLCLFICAICAFCSCITSLTRFIYFSYSYPGINQSTCWTPTGLWVQQADNAYYAILSLYVVTYHIHFFCMCFTLRLLQKHLPSLALGHGASLVNFCNFNLSLRLPAFNLCWHAVFLIHSANPAGHFQDNITLEDSTSSSKLKSAWLPPFVCESYCRVYICHSVCYMCMWSAFPKRECQTLRHGPGFILMQAHGVELRLGDNCCSEEWMAWELSSSTDASHQAVHHMDLMTDTLWGETKAISSLCAQLMHKHTELT